MLPRSATISPSPLIVACGSLRLSNAADTATVAASSTDPSTLKIVTSTVTFQAATPLSTHSCDRSKTLHLLSNWARKLSITYASFAFDCCVYSGPHTALNATFTSASNKPRDKALASHELANQSMQPNNKALA